MRKILQINSLIGYGSTGRIVEEIGNLAISKGWKSYIAYGRNDAESKSHKIRIGNKWSILWHVFLTRFFDLHGFGSKKATMQFIKKIEKIQPDIIHLHNVHGYYINIEILFRYLSSVDVPIVWTLHDCWAFMGHGAYFKSKKEKQGVTYLTSPKSDYPQSWFFDRSKKEFLEKKRLFSALNNLTLIPVSSWLENVLNNSFMKKYTVQRISNGVNLEVFSPMENLKSVKNRYNINNKFVLLGVASPWSERKRLQDFIKFSNFLKLDEVIILLGVSKKIIKNLPSNIIGIQRTENMSKLVELYSVADIVLNLSVQESFGLTSVEGYACGTPTIVYEATASPELVSQNTGFVVPIGDLKSLRLSLDKIKNKGKKYYSKFCVEKANKFYNKNDKFREYVKLYETLIRNKKNDEK